VTSTAGPAAAIAAANAAVIAADHAAAAAVGPAPKVGRCKAKPV